MFLTSLDMFRVLEEVKVEIINHIKTYTLLNAIFKKCNYTLQIVFLKLVQCVSKY